MDREIKKLKKQERPQNKDDDMLSLINNILHNRELLDDFLIADDIFDITDDNEGENDDD